jgi:hypothetical protein
MVFPLVCPGPGTNKAGDCSKDAEISHILSHATNPPLTIYTAAYRKSLRAYIVG